MVPLSSCKGRLINFLDDDDDDESDIIINSFVVVTLNKN